MQIRTFSRIVLLSIIAASCTIAWQDGHAATKEELKALRAEKKAACKMNADCAATLEKKAEARREKAAAKLRNEIATLRGESTR